MRAAFFASLVCCGGVVGDADGGKVDGAADANQPSDGGGDAPFWDGGVCDPHAPTFPDKGCDSTRNIECEQWAQSVAIGAFGASMCVAFGGGFAFCGSPDCSGNCCGGGPVCDDGYVCASKTEGATRECIKACSGL